MHLAQTACPRASQSPSSISSPSFCLHHTMGVLPPPSLAPCAPWQVWGAAGPRHVLQLAYTAAGIWQAAVCFCTCKHGQLNTDVPLPMQVLIISLLSTGNLPTSCSPRQGPQHTPRAQPGIQGANLGSDSPSLPQAQRLQAPRAHHQPLLRRAGSAGLPPAQPSPSLPAGRQPEHHHLQEAVLLADTINVLCSHGFDAVFMNLELSAAV